VKLATPYLRVLGAVRGCRDAACLLSLALRIMYVAELGDAGTRRATSMLS
jgi:hypothetical protein